MDNIPFSINRRKRTARRAFKKHPLFAVQMVSERLSCEYSENVLHDDLKLKRKPKTKRKKVKPRFDFRFMQLKKLSERIITTDDEKEKQNLITRYVLMSEAEKRKQDIHLIVTYKGEAATYMFNWKTNEKVIKDISIIANKSKSFEQFEEEKEKYLNQFSYGN